MLSLAQFERVLALNNAFAKETSFLTPDDLTRLLQSAYFIKTLGALDAFLIAMDHNSNYDGVNFNWFKQRYDRFIYVDRIITAPEARGKGSAKSLYFSLMEQAKADGIEVIGCEINQQPPNPGSVAFHQKLDFELIDSAALSAEKTVGYWLKKL